MPPKGQFKKPSGRPKKRSMTGTAAMFNPGRPPKMNMSDVSYSTKLRRAHDLVQQYDYETIQLALNFAKRNENVDENGESNQVDNVPIKHSHESAFAFFLENDFSKKQWERLVADSKKQGAEIYPSFYMLSKVKEQCRPHCFSVQNEIAVEVPFQLMLNLSAERLINADGTEWSQHDLNRLILICPYGFDSSSGFKNPHQRFHNVKNVTLKSELSLFASTFVLSALVTSNGIKMWVNPTPQSVRFCRPLRIALEKETNDAVTAERNRLKSEVDKFQSHRFSLPNGKHATVNFDVRLTMVDGKCLNFLLENGATTRCPICNLTMDNFNTANDWKSVVPDEHLKHGIGNLHCEIKTLELLIKLSCRITLGMGTWTVRKEFKATVEDAMDEIKENLFKAFSVRVGEVQHGSGTSLTGNTARKCLKDHQQLSEILNVNEDLIKRLWYVLLAFRQKEGIDLVRLDQYCTETYKLYFESYTWAKMNPSVHKLLRHGVKIARRFPLSLAYFSEDAAESMHKHYRKNCTAHARQNSRENRLLDVFNRAVDLSDPALSIYHLGDRVKQVHDDLPSDFIELFKIKTV